MTSDDISVPQAQRLNLVDDIPDFGGNGAKNTCNWFAIQGGDFIKRYIDSGLHILICDLGIDGSGEKYDVVVRAAPVRISEFGCASLAILDDGQADNIRDGDEAFVLAHIAYFVQSPEKIIPSLVWFKPAKQRVNFGGTAPPPFAQYAIKLIQPLAKREFGVSQSLVYEAKAVGQDVAGLVNSGPEIYRSVEGDQRKVCRDGAEFNLVKMMQSCTVYLNNSGMWFTIQPTSDLLLKVGNVVLCACDM